VPDSANFAKGRKRFRLICLALALSFVIIGVRLVTLGFAAMDRTIGQKTVTYDFHRLMEGAKLVRCSEFGRAIIEHM